MNTSKSDLNKLRALVGKFLNITTTSLLSSGSHNPEQSVLAQYMGATIEELVINVGTEISERNLSNRQRYRTGISIIQIIEKVSENLNSGKKIREDDFFDGTDENGKAADELLEGLLINIQDEYEEKKVKYISRMFANFLFDTIDKEFCNTYIRVANTLTYRQFCYIYLLNNKVKFGLTKNIHVGIDPFRALRGDQIIELHELRDRAIIIFPEIFLQLDPTQGAQMFPLEQANVLPFGKYLYDYLDLKELDILDVEKLCDRKATQ